MLFILTLFMPFLALGFLFWYVVFRAGSAVVNLVRPLFPFLRRGGGAGGERKERREERDPGQSSV